MSCPNGLLVRFKVRVMDSPFELKSVPKVTKVGGISLGTDGTEELTEYNKVIELSNGQTKFDTLTLTVRYELTPISIEAFRFFKNFWDKRSNKTHSIYVDFCTRQWDIIMTYKLTHCSMKAHSLPSEFEIGVERTFEYTMQFNPYDVQISPLGL